MPFTNIYHLPAEIVSAVMRDRYFHDGRISVTLLIGPPRIYQLRKRFSSYQDATRFLRVLRYQVDEGTFDARDHQASHPLSFRALAEKWLRMKQSCGIAKKTWNNLDCYMRRAINFFGDRNVKTIKRGDLGDLLCNEGGDRGFRDVASKRRHNVCYALREFLKRLVEREKITAVQMRRFPTVKYDMRFREIIDKETQTKILEEIWRLTDSNNPKIWIAIQWLATYPLIRPGELLSLREEDVNRENGVIIIQPQRSKERRPKIVPLIPEDIALLRELPAGHILRPAFSGMKKDMAASSREVFLAPGICGSGGKEPVSTSASKESTSTQGLSTALWSPWGRSLARNNSSRL